MQQKYKKTIKNVKIKKIQINHSLMAHVSNCGNDLIIQVMKLKYTTNNFGTYPSGLYREVVSLDRYMHVRLIPRV